MTATVTPPPGAASLKRVDPALRLQDYAAALKFYSARLEAGVVDAIVFVENSNSDVSMLKELASHCACKDRIEFVSFFGLDYPSAYGRAYGEMKLVDYAMSHSRCIFEAEDESMVWKITGRYLLRNIEQVIRVWEDAVLVCHCRNHPQRWADMYFMGWMKRHYPQLLQGVYGRLKESELGEPSEVEFRRIVDERARSVRVQRRFLTVPRLEGVRGFDNAAFERQRGKAALRACMARMMPWVWI